MTLRVNPTFAAALASAQQNNGVWSTTFKNGLGATRRVICKRVADAATPDADVFASGAVFRNAALTGEMVISGGVVTHYGVTSDLTTALPADLSTGKSVLRIEGNGNWIEGTLGLVGSDCDFVLPANPTATNSIAVSPNMRISPPPFLPSGTGFTPPALDANAPAYVAFEDWTNSAVEVGRVYLDTRRDNLVFTDPEVAAEMGDIRVTQSSNTVVLGEFEFGATMFSMNSAVNSSPEATLHQVLIGCKPTEANWPRYPRTGGYRRATRVIDGVNQEYGLSNTFPPPFKAKICKADGTVLFTHEMRDGLPINSPQLSYVPTLTKAVRPHWHCGSLLPWQSGQPLLSTKKNKYVPPVHASALRPSIGKERTNFNAVDPFTYPFQRTSSTGHWHAVGKWTNPASQTAVEANQVAQVNDPYLFLISADQGGWGTYDPWTKVKEWHNVDPADYSTLTGGQVLRQGWGYEPGAHTMHDHMTGPGGVRIDRAALPGPTVIHMTNPNWVHLRDLTPISEMVKDWNLGYFNHAWHTLTNVRTFEGLPNKEVLAGDWGYGESYYSQQKFYKASAEYAVPLFAVPNGGTYFPNRPFGGAVVDANFRLPWNGSAIDNLHNYSNPGLIALLYNSPMHAFSAKLRYHASILAQINSSVAGSFVPVYYAQRNHAWRLLHEATMWKLASDHPLMVSRADVEKRIIAELTGVYETIYKPLYVNNDQTPFFKVLRNLGLSVQYAAGAWQTNSAALHHYMGGVMMLWKQFGLFRRMWNHSEPTQKGLLCIIKTLDAHALGFFQHTDGEYIGMGGNLYSGAPILMAGDNTLTNPDVPTGWDDWKARVWPKVGQADWIHNSEGGFRTPNPDTHLIAQWPYIRKIFFSDIACDYNLDAVIAKLDGFHAAWEGYIANLEATGSKRGVALAEWTLPPGYARPLAPTTLGD